MSYNILVASLTLMALFKTEPSELDPRGVLWYFHTYVGSVHFLGVKFLNFNIFWGFHKNLYFLRYEHFVDIFLGSAQNWTSYRGYFYVF